MSDTSYRDRVYSAARSPDDLSLPFIFIPHGAPMPTEWMAAHPGWLKIPACLIPEGAPMPREWMAEHPGWLKFPATFEQPAPIQTTQPDRPVSPTATMAAPAAMAHASKAGAPAADTLGADRLSTGL